eukprot:scaffold624_cov402-Prasinococcus_capsulatus_cf.AAC.16
MSARAADRPWRSAASSYGISAHTEEYTHTLHYTMILKYGLQDTLRLALVCPAPCICAASAATASTTLGTGGP